MNSSFKNMIPTTSSLGKRKSLNCNICGEELLYDQFPKTLFHLLSCFDENGGVIQKCEICDTKNCLQKHIGGLLQRYVWRPWESKNNGYEKNEFDINGLDNNEIEDNEPKSIEIEGINKSKDEEDILLGAEDISFSCNKNVFSCVSEELIQRHNSSNNKCEFCVCVFNTKTSLQKHIESFHSFSSDGNESKNIESEYSESRKDESEDNKDILHWSWTDEDELFGCNKCDFSCGSEELLQKHKISKGFKSDFVLDCNKCDFQSCQMTDMESHKLKTHSSTTNNTNFQPTHMKKFEIEASKNENTIIHEEEKSISYKTPIITSIILYCLCRQPERPGMLGCDFCDEWFHRSCLKLSQNEAEELTKCEWMCPKCELKCEFCTKSFLQASKLQNHIREVHRGDGKKHKCNSCDKTFTTSINLKTHIQMVHEGRKFNKCETCGKYFQQSGHLKMHISTVHEGHKDYKCDSCGKLFSRVTNLNTHINTVHDGHKDYNCKSCGKWHVSTHLRRHSYSIHKKCRKRLNFS